MRFARSFPAVIGNVLSALRGIRRWIDCRLNLHRLTNQEVELTLVLPAPARGSTDVDRAMGGDPIIVSRKSLRELMTLGRRHLYLYGFLGTAKRLLSIIRTMNSAIPEAKPPSQESHLSESATRRLLQPPAEVLPVKVSVVIPTKNGIAEDFERTLQAISMQKGIEDIEIVVVDSGSSDDTVAIAEEYGAEVYTIPPEEFNHGTTRNYGAEQTTGELLVFMTQDAIPATEDLFYQMAREALADPRLAAVSVSQIPKSSADMYARWELWQHYDFLFRQPLPLVGSPENIARLSSQDLRRLASMDNVCAMVQRRIWDRIRFKPTIFGEDVAFGLSCVEDGYRIGLLPHCAVFHSHTRPAFYYLARLYVDRLVFVGLLKEHRVRWTKAATLNQLLTSAKELYLAICKFAGSLESSSACDPVLVLRELLSYISTPRGLIHRPQDQHGEATLDHFFRKLEGLYEHDLPHVNCCTAGFEWKLNSILQFLQGRSSLPSGPELLTLLYKAYAGTAGSMWGEFCFWQKQQGTWSSQAERLDSLLQGGMGR